MTDIRKNILRMSCLIACFSALFLWNCVEIPDYAILKVKASPSEGGTASISPPGPEYADGTRVTLTAKEATGYAFTHWDGYVSGTSKVVTATIAGDKYNEKTATANFVKVYTLTVINNPAAGGTTTADGTAIHRTGTQVTVKATSNPGYRFDRWSGASTSKDPEVTINMDSNKTLTANYVRVFRLEIGGITANNGTVTVALNSGTSITYTEPIIIDTGTVVKVSVTAKSGYRFTGWSGTPSSVNPSDASITFPMTKDLLPLFANFGRVYTLRVDNNPAAGGTTTHDGTTFHNDTTQVTVTARPNEGYRFDRWSGASTSTNPIVTITMNSDKALTANYVRVFWLVIGITANIGTVTVTVNGTPITYTEPIIIDAGTVVKVSVTAKSGYRFTGWSGAPSSVIPSDTSITFPMTKDLSLVANFGRVYTLTIVPNNGSVWITVNETTFTYMEETSIEIVSGTYTVTATANSGYIFDGWSGASDSTTSTTTIIMDDNKTLTANFTPY